MRQQFFTDYRYIKFKITAYRLDFENRNTVLWNKNYRKTAPKITQYRKPLHPPYSGKTRKCRARKPSPSPQFPPVFFSCSRFLNSAGLAILDSGTGYISPRINLNNLARQSSSLHIQQTLNSIIYTSLFHYCIQANSKAIALEEKHNASLHYDAGLALRML